MDIGNFDPGNVIGGGVYLIALVFGLVEFFKLLLGWEGRRVTILSMFIGVLTQVAFELIPLLPPTYALVFGIVVRGLTFGLAAAGIYKFTAPRLPVQDDQLPLS